MAENILVVDDDDAIRNMLDGFLKLCGYKVDSAEGVDTALKLIESNDYDIMLIGINMPGIDGGSQGGIDLLRHVQSKSLSSGVLMMTGNPTVESTAEALKLGAFDYLHKPFSLGHLRLMIKRLLQNRNL
jgi:DNA-binding NtrC family response regulator